MLGLRLTGPNQQSFNCLACVDTGADHCVFPLTFALALGLNPLTMKKQFTGGVGSAANLTFYDTITIDFGVGGHAIYAGFTAGLEAMGFGLLGQSGFMERYNLQFNRSAGKFHIEI